MSEWIDVKDRLPEIGDRVILWDAMFRNADTAKITFDPSKLDGDYTHWMPLPEPPK